MMTNKFTLNGFLVTQFIFALGSVCNHSTGSCHGAPTASLHLLQKRQTRANVLSEFAEQADTSRGAAKDAQFLMKATFGPTRTTLRDLGSTTYADWIQAQMDLPVESHREYYRKRANPRFADHLAKFTDNGGGFTARDPCSKGSRWALVEDASVVTGFTETNAPFDEFAHAPGVLLLASTQDRCAFGQSAFIKVGGQFYQHDPRMELFDNLPNSPRILQMEDEECPQVPDPLKCRLNPPGEACLMACGSEGEVANDPFLGHQWAFNPRHHDNNDLDEDYDNKFTNLNIRKTKFAVWLNMAMFASDQLRQRVAWALSQIFVVAGGDSKDEESESWVHYYDIMVRNAFGNLRDILGNITFSPVMANYLTYIKSFSYDDSGTYADENYAREIMQLFTIGLEMLNADGTPQLDEQGSTVPTYTNQEITAIARVFTGFISPPTRTNTETKNAKADPLHLREDRHDVYPKPDLFGNFLGDGYPLCADAPARAFLNKGATYEFRGYEEPPATKDDIYVVDPQSALFTELCQESSGACQFSLVRQLSADLGCTAGECKMDTVRTLKVSLGASTGYYEYAAPACVYHFFYNGVVIAQGNKLDDPAKQRCAAAAMPVAGASCCTDPATSCTDTPPSGKTCKDVSSKKCGNWQGKGSSHCRMTCFELGAGYAGDNCTTLRSEARICGHKLETGARLAVAEALCAAQGLQLCTAETPDTEECAFNTNNNYVWTRNACDTSLQVHGDGKVSGHTDNPEPNRFAVQWLDGVAPSPGSYTLSVEVQPVFTQSPSGVQFSSERPAMVGAYPPSTPCDAPACGDDNLVCYCGALTADTVFEFEGLYYKNSRSYVVVGGRRFRNPPVFRIHRVGKVVTDWGGHTVRTSIREINSQLDHLFYHQNTAPFTAKLLIQRLVKSNPSPEYVRSVVEAFRTGSYGGQTYSGKYGDLGATVRAILLHPEALEQTAEVDGALREPLLRIVHFMRAMEYRPEEAIVALDNLQNHISQGPYTSPTVFNFYDPDFSPDRFHPDVYAPEFQIFDGPSSMAFLNGMISLVENGLVDEEYKSNTLQRPGFGEEREATQGNLTFEQDASLSVEGRLDELDVLLTGQRLSPGSKELVSSAYSAAPEGRKLAAAQEAIILSPEFNTYGAPLPAAPTERQLPPPRSGSRDYKAVVLLFLRGGADTWNFVVPLECDLYEEYKAVRTDIAYTSPKDFHKVRSEGQRCERFGIHGALPSVAGLYNDGHAAFISNIGALVEPLTRETYFTGGKLCQGLMSHKHMQAASQSSVCQVTGGSAKGVGGRMADALSSGSEAWNVASFSLGGNNIYSKGHDTNFQVIDPKYGSVRFFYLDTHGDVLANMSGQAFGNVFAEEYAQAIVENVHASEELGEQLDKVDVSTDYKRGTKLQMQFHQVSRLMATREERHAERDFFFVQMNKWDHHHDLKSKLSESLAEVDDAIKGFVDELKAQGVFESVTMITHSDFGRTLTSNGDGADHAYAGQQFVISGSLNGGRVFNDYPSTLLEHSGERPNDQDIGRGRLVPKYPWESVMVPVAKWMGVEESQLASVFPNLAHFNESHIIGSASRVPLYTAAS